MAEPTAQSPPTMAQILEAIKTASTENIKAFKDALKISDSTSTSADTSGLDAKALEMLSKRAQLTSQISKMKGSTYTITCKILYGIGLKTPEIKAQLFLS